MSRRVYRINREGTSQQERYPEALSPDYVKIDERSLIDMVKQSAEYARYVAYYDGSDISGDWRDLFSEIYDYETGKSKFSSVEELEGRGALSPHIALFLAFLKIFGVAQDSLNNLKERHLDLYYREVLGMEPTPAKPDSVALLFELNKAARQAIVPSGTLFDAGKDANGKPMRYVSKNDLIVNPAKIEIVNGLYLQKSSGVNIYALGDMLNSATEDYDKESVRFMGSACKERARIGFAIASPLFDLKDGERTIVLEFKQSDSGSFNETSFETLCTKYFEATYTTAGSWESAKIEVSGRTISIKIKSTQPPTMPYSESVHLMGLDTSCPAICFKLKEDIEASLLAFLARLSLEKIKTRITGSTQIRVTNRYGLLDHRKAFLPFGPQPIKGSNFDIAGEPIFNEYLKSDSLKLNITWKPGAPILLPTCPSSSGGNVSFELKTTYCRLKLNYDFGYASYPSKLASEIIAAYNDSKASISSPPYIPEIESISVDYDTNSSSEFSLFHLHPFGQVMVKTRDVFVFDTREEGALLFGIAELDFPAILSLYLRLSDYGANFDKVIPLEGRPVWHYLNGDSWVEFRKQDIILDSTNGFSKSGMVYLNIGADAFLEHTILPAPYLWLKLSFYKDSDAFPLLESVETQAAEAMFVNCENEVSHLGKGLPANTISKPLTLIPGIRSVKQPYPSFGGRASESNREYHTRVSERLRHKDRAWDIWDYERLVLERFPEIFKVKCIPYYKPDVDYAPGSVTLILLPDCNVIPQRDMLKPRVTKALVNDVEKFILSRCSPFVSLHVDNPSYGEIRLDCSVSLMEECRDESFYRNQLAEDIKRLLSPWIDNDFARIDFGSTLSKARIIYFIEKLPYIDYILSLNVILNDREVRDDEELHASLPNAILTSAEYHNIKIV